MLVHLLGWLTVVATGLTTVVTCRVLYQTGREQRSWLRKLPVPKNSAGTLTLSSGSDYVGVV